MMTPHTEYWTQGQVADQSHNYSHEVLDMSLASSAVCLDAAEDVHQCCTHNKQNIDMETRSGCRVEWTHWLGNEEYTNIEHPKFQSETQVGLSQDVSTLFRDGRYFHCQVLGNHGVSSREFINSTGDVAWWKNVGYTADTGVGVNDNNETFKSGYINSENGYSNFSQNGTDSNSNIFHTKSIGSIGEPIIYTDLDRQDNGNQHNNSSHTVTNADGDAIKYCGDVNGTFVHHHNENGVLRTNTTNNSHLRVRWSRNDYLCDDTQLINGSNDQLSPTWSFVKAGVDSFKCKELITHNGRTQNCEVTPQWNRENGRPVHLHLGNSKFRSSQKEPNYFQKDNENYEPSYANNNNEDSRDSEDCRIYTDLDHQHSPQTIKYTLHVETNNGDHFPFLKNSLPKNKHIITSPRTSKKETACPDKCKDDSVLKTDENKSKETRLVLPPCRICGAKASGFHYGVNSCEACKGFFRRALKRPMLYHCTKNKSCDVKGNMRSSCRFCRYKRCLKLGMSKEAIKTGRYSHKKRTNDTIEVKRLQNNPLDLSNQSESQILVKSLFSADEKCFKSNSKGLDKDLLEQQEHYLKNYLSRKPKPRNLKLVTFNKSPLAASSHHSNHNATNHCNSEKFSFLSQSWDQSQLKTFSSKSNVNIYKNENCDKPNKILTRNGKQNNSVHDVKGKVELRTNMTQDTSINKEHFSSHNAYCSRSMDYVHCTSTTAGSIKQSSELGRNQRSECNKIQFGKIQIANKGVEDVHKSKTATIARAENWVTGYVAFARSLPGFSSFSSHDQASLLRHAWDEVWILNAHRGFNKDLAVATMPSGTCFHIEEMESGWGKEYARLAFSIAEVIKRYCLSSELLTLLKAISIVSPDRCELDCKSEVERLNWTLVTHLIRYIESYHANDHGLFARLVNVLSLLREISEKAQSSMDTAGVDDVLNSNALANIFVPF